MYLNTGAAKDIDGWISIECLSQNHSIMGLHSFSCFSSNAGGSSEKNKIVSVSKKFKTLSTRSYFVILVGLSMQTFDKAD